MANSLPISLPSENRRVLLVSRPVDIPGPYDFSFDVQPVTEPADGELLIRNIYLSVDPAQRGWAADSANYSEPVPLGSVMRSLGLGRVVVSRHAAIAEGTFVYGWLGWQDYALVRPDALLALVDSSDLPLSAYAGPLGINGLTAKLALEKVGRPAARDVVLVSTAAGAVGSLVGQIARRYGCRTIGLAGGPEKVDRCMSRYGYDSAIDYRAGALEEAIERCAPDGVDIYFDNVGGKILDLALRRMRVRGRIVQCGTASVPSWSPVPTGPRSEREILTRRLSWQGFVIFDHLADFPDARSELAEMIRTGELVYDEDIAEGLECAPGALERLYSGENVGKSLIFLG